MSKVFFMSDLHLGHINVNKFEDFFRPKAMTLPPMRLEELIKVHDERIINNINDAVGKRDKLFLLGDLGYNTSLLRRIKTKKITLILGNHDTESAEKYQEFFDSHIEIRGMHSYKGFWLSHCPIHPNELYGKKNIHGHVHSKSVFDDRYINVSIEACGGYPVDFDDIKSGKYQEGSDYKNTLVEK